MSELEKKISKLESQSQRQSEKVSLLLQQVEELTRLSQKLFSLIEESLYENELKSSNTVTNETKQPTGEKEITSFGNTLKDLIRTGAILN